MEFDLDNPESLLIPKELEREIINNLTDKTLKKIFLHGRALKISDVSFQEDRPIMVKVNNHVRPISKLTLQNDTIKRIIGISHGSRPGDDSAYDRVMMGEDANSTFTFKANTPGEARIPIRYRINKLRDGNNGASMVCRYNNDRIFDLEEIGLNPDSEIYRRMFPMKGLNLFTGAVDSGKTSTIFAYLKHFILNDSRSAFINTYENPIEADLMRIARDCPQQNKSVFQCPMPNGQIKTFMQGIEQSLRRNADIIVTGEVRTGEEIMALINGAIATGKLLMATVHSDNVPVTLNRLIRSLQLKSESETESIIYDLIQSLNIICSQKLLTTKKLMRIGVYEYLYFSKEIKNRLLSIPISQISNEIKKIMLENGDTMVDKAKVLYDDGLISKDTFDEFSESFSY